MSFAFAPLPAEELAAIRMRGLHERWRNCGGCTLCAQRRSVVFGAGNPAAPIMVISSNVNWYEDKEGRPFAGSGGQVFLQALERVGLIPKRDIYATHVAKCLPPKVLKDGKTARATLTAEQLAACRPALLAQLEIVNPAIVVLQGRQANQALTGDPRPPVKYMGTVRMWGKNRIAVSTFNPAGFFSGERPMDQKDYLQHWDEIAIRLHVLGRLWRPDALCFQEGWEYKEFIDGV